MRLIRPDSQQDAAEIERRYSHLKPAGWGKRRCLARLPRPIRVPGYYTCTLEAGHSGPHAAGVLNKVIAVWDEEEVHQGIERAVATLGGWHYLVDWTDPAVYSRGGSPDPEKRREFERVEDAITFAKQKAREVLYRVQIVKVAGTSGLTPGEAYIVFPDGQVNGPFMNRPEG